MLELLIVLYILTRKESFWDPLKEISFLVHAPWQHHITPPSFKFTSVSEISIFYCIMELIN
jgi:hypothetical protein